MKRFSILPIAAVLFPVVAGTLAPAAAEERPFSASGAGYVYSSNYQGLGNATHLGRIFLGMGLQQDLFGSGTFFPSRTGYLRSASGDELYFHFDAQYYDFDPATGIVSATLTFTGGTGRFEDATGRADVMFLVDMNFTHSDYQYLPFLIDGSIDY